MSEDSKEVSAAGSLDVVVRPWVGKLQHSRGLCDDWGCIRDESGKIVLQVNCSRVPEKDLYRHRKKGTDPTQPVVDYLLAVLNAPNTKINDGGANG